MSDDMNPNTSATEPTEPTQTIDASQLQSLIEASKQQEQTIKEMQEKHEESRKNWQSKIDTLISEKKSTEKTKMTVEEQLQQMQAELQSERVSNAREKAIASNKLDGSIVDFAKLLLSDDAETINTGAVKMSEFINLMVEKQTAAALQEKFKGQTPQTNNEQKPDKSISKADFERLNPKERMEKVKQGFKIFE